MTYASFLVLHNMIRAGMVLAIKEKRDSDKAVRWQKTLSSQRQHISNPRPLPPNGEISTSVRLAIALRYFAGGSMYDLSPLYGVGITDCRLSVWYVVQAIHSYPDFAISYPSNHDEQRAIARGFAAKSTAGFTCCAGAVDGILIWTHRPFEDDAKEAAIDAGKCYCPRKNKYGLNCQATCDSQGKIIDILCMFPGSTSDYLAFEASTLYQKLKNDPSYLADGLCLFGDNAYVNTPFLATPFPNTSSGPPDWYNFYHSQLRIRVECCFGILVQRWGILRSAIPRGVSLTKTIRLVIALAKLHNFCIDQSDAIRPTTDKDELHIRLNEHGFVQLDHIIHADGNRREPIPAQLLGGGDVVDYPGSIRRNRNGDTNLPRTRLLLQVIESGLQRPVPRPRRH